ncbi:hypothetical protein [Saccharopolyspora sp. NPDC002686]
MVNSDTDRTHISALHILENGPHAPQCPRGHGPLTTAPDEQSPTGVALSCPVCGQRRDNEVSMLRALLNPGTARFDTPLQTSPAPAPRSAPEPEPTSFLQPSPEPTPAPIPAPTPVEATMEIAAVRAEAVREPLGKTTSETPREDTDDFDFPQQLAPRSRGQRPDGTIRTTGWLQLGRLRVSSGWWAALAGAAPALALTDLATWLPAALPAVTWTGWFTTVRWLRPASPALNRERVHADELLPGDPIRIYGPIGPVGIVEQVTPTTDEKVLVRFVGGTQRTLPTDTRCRIVHLLA